jgi:nucleotide-binding universal stress UspA family protein
VIPEIEPPTTGARSQEHPRILVPLALWVGGEAKLAVVEAQAHALGASVVLLHVLEGRTTRADGSVTPAEARARTYLDTVAARLRAGGIDARPLVRHGPVAQEVPAAARELGATLLVLGADARPGLARFLPGGHADSIVRRAPCPVMLVHPIAPAPRKTRNGRKRPAPVLRGFTDDATRAGQLVSRPRGTRTVELARIVGTAGDPADLGVDFRPHRRWWRDDQRFKFILAALEEGAILPPIELYKLGYGYYVVDGHHRVAAARHRHQLWLDAEVTEFLPLGDTEVQRVFTERLRFEQATGLKSIGAGRPGTYERLEALVRAFAAAERFDDVHDAAVRWYGSLFRPAQLRTRALGLSQHFPGERTADVLLRAIEGRPPGGDGAEAGDARAWEDAVDALAEAVALPVEAAA